jgi:hypothetical protein
LSIRQGHQGPVFFTGGCIYLPGRLPDLKGMVYQLEITST